MDASSFFVVPKTLLYCYPTHKGYFQRARSLPEVLIQKGRIEKGVHEEHEIGREREMERKKRTRKKSAKAGSPRYLLKIFLFPASFCDSLYSPPSALPAKKKKQSRSLSRGDQVLKRDVAAPRIEKLQSRTDERMGRRSGGPVALVTRGRSWGTRYTVLARDRRRPTPERRIPWTPLCVTRGA